MKCVLSGFTCEDDIFIGRLHDPKFIAIVGDDQHIKRIEWMSTHSGLEQANALIEYYAEYVRKGLD